MGQDFVVVEKEETVPCPEHLSGAEAAALPLTGLTAWRALITKSGAAARGQDILVTGIGGGVALMALAFAVAMGVRVWVSSGDMEKVERAKRLGAQGGVSYKEKDWDRELKGMMPEDKGYLDAIIDGAGGDIGVKGAKLLKVSCGIVAGLSYSHFLTNFLLSVSPEECFHLPFYSSRSLANVIPSSQPGGVLVSYGMTVGPSFALPIPAVLKNIDVRGSTMGSRQEFHDMVAFVADKKVKPVVSRVVEGSLDDVEAWEQLFDDMKAGRQFGKLVFEVKKEGRGAEGGSSSSSSSSSRL